MSAASTGIQLDFSHFNNFIQQKRDDVINEVEVRMQDATDDLARISSNIAPIKDSPLRRSVSSSVERLFNKMIGEVSFSVTEAGGEDYAIWIHEANYNLGVLSRASPGTDGYQVGNKYLERPLFGEKDKYFNWLADGARDALRS